MLTRGSSVPTKHLVRPEAQKLAEEKHQSPVSANSTYNIFVFILELTVHEFNRFQLSNPKSCHMRILFCYHTIWRLPASFFSTNNLPILPQIETSWQRCTQAICIHKLWQNPMGWDGFRSEKAESHGEINVSLKWWLMSQSMVQQKQHMIALDGAFNMFFC